MKRKHITFAAALFLCLATLLGCTGDHGSSVTGTEENTTAAETSAPEISVVSGGQTAFKIIRPEASDSADADVQAAKRLKRSIREATGCDLAIETDWRREAPVPDDSCEILVGRTKRDVTSSIPADLQKDEYYISVSGNKILLCASSDLGYELVIDAFLAEFLGYDRSTGKYAKDDLLIPQELCMREKFIYPETVFLIQDIKSTASGSGQEVHNDIIRLIASLQGTLNRTAAESKTLLYFTYDQTDGFWLDYITGEGRTFAGIAREGIGSWNEFWSAFGGDVMKLGMVLWDPDVPATANVAATICSAEGFLPVRYSEKKSSLYQWLKAKGVPERISLVGKFTGSGTIADTDLPSSGSAKCDAYLWALEKYLDKCSSDRIAYVLDGATCTEGNAMYKKIECSDPNWNQIFSHDFFIYNRCFFFDLTCTENEIPCDDPGQPMGTDAATLKKILTVQSQRNNGKMVKLFGFPPWYAKYTNYNDNGKLVPTTLEWNFVDFISQYNFVKEADAAHPSWMTNASVYCQYEPKAAYKNSEPAAKEVFDPKTRYFTIYLGDYDSSAWLKNSVPSFFSDAKRGTLPLIWGFNPNLGDRVPMIFDYVYENATPNDYFVTGDSGAGYVCPSCLGDLDLWAEYNKPYLAKYDMDVVGFIINTTHPVTDDVLRAYAEFAPVGSFHNDPDRHLTVLNGKTVYMHLMNGVNATADGAPAAMYSYAAGTGDSFSAFRTVCVSPSDVSSCIARFISYANAKNDGYTYKYVDVYTLFDLALQSGQGEKIN